MKLFDSSSSEMPAPKQTRQKAEIYRELPAWTKLGSRSHNKQDAGCAPCYIIKPTTHANLGRAAGLYALVGDQQIPNGETWSLVKQC